MLGVVSDTANGLLGTLGDYEHILIAVLLKGRGSGQETILTTLPDFSHCIMANAAQTNFNLKATRQVFWAN